MATAHWKAPVSYTHLADVKNVQAEEYTDLAAALAETVEGARPYAQTCGVTLRFENRSKGPCGLLCDTQRLDRIVLNLLSNALKHTPGGGAEMCIRDRDITTCFLCLHRSSIYAANLYSNLF